MLNKTELKKTINSLEEAQKGCSARTIDNIDLTTQLERVQKHLSNIGIKKKNLKGLKVTICSNFGGKVPASYSGIPQGTFLDFEYTTSLKLVKVERRISKGNDIDFIFEFNESQKSDIIENFSTL